MKNKNVQYIETTVEHLIVSNFLQCFSFNAFVRLLRARKRAKKLVCVEVSKEQKALMYKTIQHMGMSMMISCSEFANMVEYFHGEKNLVLDTS